MQNSRATSGFSLLELAIACAVASIIFVLVGSLFKKSTEGLEYFTSVGQAELQMRRAIDGMAEDIQQAIVDTSGSGPSITITTGTSHDGATIQRARGTDPAVDPTENIETVTYSVNSAAELVRTVAWRQAGVNYTNGPRICALHVDSLAGGQKGFSIARVTGTDLYTISIRVAINIGDRQQTPLKCTFATTVRVRT